MDDADLFVDYDAPLALLEVERLLQRVDDALVGGRVPEQEILRLWWGSAQPSHPLHRVVGPLYGLLNDWHERLAPQSQLQALMVAAAIPIRSVAGRG